MVKQCCCSILYLLIFCMLVLHGRISSADALNGQNTSIAIPKLVRSIRFEDPVSYCGIRVPFDQQQVKERLEKELLLALWDRPQVILWIKRSARYFPVIEKILKENDLPMDLKYVPLIESALRPHAGSLRGAVGFWQFLRSTGRQYGLKINSHVDERRNIFASTRAAGKYLKALNAEFDSFLLTVSAFNMGAYALKTEIKAQENTDFFTLHLPLETQRYIFKLIAAKLIIENQADYGFDLQPQDLYPELAYDRVTFESEFEIPIVLIAQAADVPFKTIKDYNPELRGYYLKKGNITLLIPKGHAAQFNRYFNAQYKNWKKLYRKRIHVVKRGESLIGIAHRYRMSVSSLLKLNNLSLNRIIHPGDRLVVE